MAGDFNAKNCASGGEIDEAKGQEIVEWAFAGGCMIENNPNSRATFQNSRGDSWIDLTLSRGVEVED